MGKIGSIILICFGGFFALLSIILFVVSLTDGFLSILSAIFLILIAVMLLNLGLSAFISENFLLTKKFSNKQLWLGILASFILSISLSQLNDKDEEVAEQVVNEPNETAQSSEAEETEEAEQTEEEKKQAEREKKAEEKRKAEARKKREAEKEKKQAAQLALAEKIINNLNALPKEKDAMEDRTYYFNTYLKNYTNVYQVYPYLLSNQTLPTASELVEDPNTLRLKMFIRYSYVGDNWLFVESLDIKTPNKKYDHYGMSFSDWERDNEAGDVWEWYNEYVSVEDDLSKYEDMASASSVLVRFNGKQYYDDHSLGANERAALKQIVTIFKDYQTLYNSVP